MQAQDRGEHQAEGCKRQAVEIIADTVQFLGGRHEGEQAQFVPATATADTSDFGPGAADDDIPF